MCLFDDINKVGSDSTVLLRRQTVSYLDDIDVRYCHWKGT